jgi:16S rRNA (cytosine967-C5)-methyltransferase
VAGDLGSGNDLADPRSVAVDVVRRVTEEGAYSNLLLPAALDRSGLSGSDRALATELAYGTLRRLLPIDAVVRELLHRGDAPPVAWGALRVGAYQLLFTRIPPHAAVGETVSAVPRPVRPLVNAVLRRLSAEPRPEFPGDDDRGISLRTGLVEWAVRALREILPAEEVEAAAQAIGERAPLTVRANPCKVETDHLAGALLAAGVEPTAGRVHSRSFRVAGGPVSALPGAAEGWFAVQDEASAWVVDVLDPQPGERVLDACAGPGGKAADIACRAGEVVAADLSPRRVGLVGATAERLGVTARLLAQDGTRPAVREGFDRVLVDAPCSGIGAARRRPELLWRPSASAPMRLAPLQVALALGAASLLRPGGILLYSVCTFPRAETDDVCDALLERAPFLVADRFPGPDGGTLDRARLWPHRHGTDAMFAARFRRRD